MMFVVLAGGVDVCGTSTECKGAIKQYVKKCMKKNKKMYRYEGNRLMFVVLAPNPKAAYKNLKFYYTILMEVGEVANKIKHTHALSLSLPLSHTHTHAHTHTYTHAHTHIHTHTHTHIRAHIGHIHVYTHTHTHTHTHTFSLTHTHT